MCDRGTFSTSDIQPTKIFIQDTIMCVMRLLIQRNIAGFAERLSKFGVECKVVKDHRIADRSYKHIRLWRQFSKEFNNIVDDFKPDVIIASPGDFGAAALRSNIPLIVYLHGNYWQEEATKRMANGMSFLNKITHKRYVATLDRCMRGSVATLAVSEYLSKIAQEKYPYKSVYTLYLGVEQALWYPEKGMTLKHPCVGLVQRATIWDKIQEMHVLKHVMDRLPKVNFYWGGSGRYAEEVLESLQGCPNFTYLGNLEYPDKVRQFLTEVDIYALLTGLDAAPQTIKEASMMAKPVIATDVGGVHEIIDDGKTGFLVRKGVSDDIVKKISYLLEDQKRACVMGSYGREYMNKNFSSDATAKKLIDILKEIGLWQ